MAKNKPTLDDILNDNSFGLLDLENKALSVKTDEDRFVDAFEEINTFYDINNREPNKGSMSEYGLRAKLENFREFEVQKKILKPYDRHHLLGSIEVDKPTIDDIFNDDLGLLEVDVDLDIFKFKHTPKPEDRAEADFVAIRVPIKEKDFKRYEPIFHQVHQQIKSGKRKLIAFKDAEKRLEEGRFYVLDGILLFLEKVNHERKQDNLGKNTARRKDGRTKIIFENATQSNMLYRSLGKSLYNNGKRVTEINEAYNQDFFVKESAVQKVDEKTGWIYVLKSKSDNLLISNIEDLYKIGFSKTKVDDRIKNAKNEATYLFSDVEKVATYECYNRHADKLEALLHNFFANACLDIDLFDGKGKRISPREWFVVPFSVIEEAIQLILSEDIVNYEYCALNKNIKLKSG